MHDNNRAKKFQSVHLGGPLEILSIQHEMGAFLRKIGKSRQPFLLQPNFIIVIPLVWLRARE